MEDLVRWLFSPGLQVFESRRATYAACSQPRFLFVGFWVIKTCVMAPCKEIQHPQCFFRIPFRIWLTVWSRKQTFRTSIRWKLKCWLKKRFERSETIVEAERTLGLKSKPPKNFFPEWKTTVDKKCSKKLTCGQNTNGRWKTYSGFTARKLEQANLFLRNWSGKRLSNKNGINEKLEA